MTQGADVGEAPPVDDQTNGYGEANGSKPLSGGELLSAISTGIVAMVREHYGRGPTRAKTYVLDDLIVCVLRNGQTPMETTMVKGGEPQRVLEMRSDFQRVMGLQYKELIERLTGCEVTAFLSTSHVDPDVTMEIFFVDKPLNGFGAAELIEFPRIDGIPRIDEN